MSKVPNWINNPSILIENKENVWPFVSTTDQNILINSITRFLIIMFIMLLIFKNINRKMMMMVLIFLIFSIGLYLMYSNEEKKEGFVYPMPEKLEKVGIIKKKADFTRTKPEDPFTEISSYFNKHDSSNFDLDFDESFGKSDIYPKDEDEKILLRETNDLRKSWPYHMSKGFENDYRTLETDGSFERDVNISNSSLYMEPREDYYLNQMHDVV